MSELRLTINWPTPHPTELRRTLLSHAAPFLRYAAPELRQTLKSYAAPFWATPHPLCYAAINTSPSHRWHCPFTNSSFTFWGVRLNCILQETAPTNSFVSLPVRVAGKDLSFARAQVHLRSSLCAVHFSAVSGILDDQKIAPLIDLLSF